MAQTQMHLLICQSRDKKASTPHHLRQQMKDVSNDTHQDDVHGVNKHDSVLAVELQLCCSLQAHIDGNDLHIVNMHTFNEPSLQV